MQTAATQVDSIAFRTAIGAARVRGGEDHGLCQVVSVDDRELLVSKSGNHVQVPTCDALEHG